MYRIALFCDEPCGFVMYCIWNKSYNIQGILKLGTGNTNILSDIITVFTYIIKVVRKCACSWFEVIVLLQIMYVYIWDVYIWSENDNLWPFKNSSTYEIYLHKSIDVCNGNCSPPPPKPKHTESSTSQRWVLHLPPKIQSVRVTKLRLCKSRFSGTLFLLPISICMYTCVSVWWL